MRQFGIEGVRLAEVLLVEDDPADAKLLQLALERSRVAVNLAWVEDGEEALSYLRKEAGYSDVVRPDLVLLDLNMPKKGGMAVLREMRETPDLAMLPVVILTTSQADEDVARSYALRANAYVAKPVGMKGFAEVLEAIDGFWFSVVMLPGHVS